jgi:hypothetical protein
MRMPIRIGRYGAVFALAFALYAAGVHPRVFAAGNDTSRFAQIEALVDLGSTSIERSRFGATIDRVELDGRSYSNKPPLLALVGAAVYAPLAAVTGWRLGDPTTGGRAITVLVLVLVALPAAWCVASFDRLLARHPGLAPRWRAATTVALAAGTLLWSYSGTLNNHVPAAALLVAALAATAGGRPLVAGLACGLAGAIDHLPGFGLAPFLGWAAARAAPAPRRAAVHFAAGVGAGLVAALAANRTVTGSALPAKMLAGAIDLSATAGPELGGVVLPQGAGYPLEVLFGGHGLFLVSPVLVAGAAGLVAAWRRPPFASATLWRALGAGIAVQIVGHALIAGSYGGWAYGFRYLLPIQPLLLVAAPAILGGRGGRWLLAVALLPSVAFAGLGAYHPWPPAFEQATRVDPVAAMVTRPVGANAAALAVELAPDSRCTEALGRRFVAADPAARRRYFAYFFASKGDLETMRRFGP